MPARKAFSCKARYRLLSSRAQLSDVAANYVRQVGTDSAQIQHSTDSVKGNLYVVEGVIHGAFETFTLPMVCCPSIGTGRRI